MSTTAGLYFRSGRLRPQPQAPVSQLAKSIGLNSTLAQSCACQFVHLFFNAFALSNNSRRGMGISVLHAHKDWYYVEVGSLNGDCGFEDIWKQGFSVAEKCLSARLT